MTTTMIDDKKEDNEPLEEADIENDSTIKSNSKKKGSFFSNFKKKFSKNKKSKSTDETVLSPKHTKNNDSGGHNKDALENNNEFKISKQSGIRLSFGKGKSNGNKEDMKDENKNKESNRSSQPRPHSMIIANTTPPRYGYLASFGWYWGPLSRAEATHYLRHTDDGSFLVRDSEGDPNKFTLSFKGAGQIFHNRILRKGEKYAFLPEEEFDSVPSLIDDAKRRSKISAYCFSRSTDTSSNPNPTQTTSGQLNESTNNQNTTTNTTTTTTNTTISDSTTNNHKTDNIDNNNSNNCKHEVRLLYPVSRYREGPRSLAYLCRFMIRQYCAYNDLDKLKLSEEISVFVKCSKYYL